MNEYAYQVYDELGIVDDKTYNYLCFTCVIYAGCLDS